MLTSTHDQLDNVVSVWIILSGVGGAWFAIREYVNRGWREARKIKDEQMRLDILDLIDKKQTLFTRVDELKVAISNCVTRDLHDQLQKELAAKLDVMRDSLSKQLSDLGMQINSRIDRLNDNRHQ